VTDPDRPAPTRRHFLCALGCAFIGDRASNPWRDIPRADVEIVEWRCFNALGRVERSISVPVWLRGERLTSERAGSDPGLALLFSLPAPPEPPVSRRELTGESLVQGEIHEVSRKVPRFIRVVHARSGEVAFTSELPDAVLRAAHQVIERSPTKEVLRRPVGCGFIRTDLSDLYKEWSPAPLEAYLKRGGLAIDVALRFRRFLQRSPEMAALIDALNSDFLVWFWRIVAQVPALPEPEGMCNSMVREEWLWRLRNREMLVEP
jgi:hypothetical protein